MIKSSIEQGGCAQITIHYTLGRNTIIYKPTDKDWLRWKIIASRLLDELDRQDLELVQVFVSPSAEEAILTFKEDKKNALDSKPISRWEENRGNIA